MYPILPLFVDEPENDDSANNIDCEGAYDDLDNYSATPKPGVVLSKMTHKSTGKNQVEISIDAFVVKEKEGAQKDEL